MIANRKGLSDVVTTVLIILLVLAAVAIIATYVLQSVKTGGEQIGNAGTCSALQMVPSCKYTVNTDPAKFDFKVLVEKKGSDANIKELDVILQKSDGTTSVKKSTVPSDLVTKPNYLETASAYSETAISAKTYSKVSVATIITSDSGASAPCAETEKVECIGP